MTDITNPQTSPPSGPVRAPSSVAFKPVGIALEPVTILAGPIRNCGNRVSAILLSKQVVCAVDIGVDVEVCVTGSCWQFGSSIQTGEWDYDFREAARGCTVGVGLPDNDVGSVNRVS